MMGNDGRLDACQAALDEFNRRMDDWEKAVGDSYEQPVGDAGSGAKVVYNRLLGGWYVVRGPHQTPLSGRFASREEAEQWLATRGRGDAAIEVRDDPPVSEAQRRAMFAAKEGHSNLGIPKSVGAEFAGADPGGKLPARKDHAYRVETIGGYEIWEGAGTDAGQWIVKQRGREVFAGTSRSAAEGYIAREQRAK